MSVRSSGRRTVAGLHTTTWTGTGPNVVALAGLTSTSAVWEPLATSIPAANVVAPDLRGRGGSQHPPGEAGLLAHARDVAAVIDELNLADVVLVGHSMGAYLAPVVAQQCPTRIAKLVLVDGGIRPAFPFFMGAGLTRLTFRRQLRSADRDWPDVESFARHGKFDRMVATRPELRTPIMNILLAELGGGEGPLHPRIDVDRAVEDAVDVFFGPALEPALDALRVPARVFLAENQKWEGQRPFISNKAVAPWLQRQPQLSVQRLPGNHLTVLFAPEVREAVASG
jgi:lipase